MNVPQLGRVTVMSNDKPRLVAVPDDEVEKLLAYGPEDLGCPPLYKCSNGWLTYAHELRAWRASQTTSGEQQ
jgi:hypothetical protein